MRDTNKQLRPWLESWGDWKRLTLAIGYPVESVSCKPENHSALPIHEPSFKLPVFTYNQNLTLEQNAQRYSLQIKTAEKRLREFHHIRRTETKLKRHGIVPNYDPHWRMNLIDRLIAMLKPQLNEIIRLRYESELKVKEISKLLGVNEDTLHRRIATAHRKLRLIPTLMVSHGTPLKSSDTASNVPMAMNK